MAFSPAFPAVLLRSTCRTFKDCLQVSRRFSRSPHLSQEAIDYGYVAVAEAQAFMERCMVATGVSTDHASALAEVLACADHRGHYSHGMNRLEMYVKDIQSGITEKTGEPTILKELAGTAWVDGNNLLGPVVGKFCIDLAIKKAKEAGIGWVVAKGSNHYSIAGWYTLRAIEQGMIGLSTTNTSPLVVPTRARKAMFGTNPISCGAPAENGDSYVLDMATSTVALGKIELNAVKEIPIPNGWGCDASGTESNDPKAVISGGGLLPLGGSEIAGGYKGYGLAMMVEVLSGILGGGAFGPNIRKWKTSNQVANLGQIFVAINPEAFAPGFEGRMSSLMDMCRSAEPAEGETEVLVAGDPERKNIAKVEKDGGLRYHNNLLRNMDTLAAGLGVKPIKRN
ncbi:uncharacterized oxidoreductase YjmC-like isoform X2 [Lytechinus variegatus]|uniref:uncharacterized oxidoreductase YjmC-like isoform X1 n=1 Tax=Lytechinus variegatus TaxID=7654 RepID=UPI001BB1590D|nr:uncharacterized oxidoreductase YjmC-like isoform X1 [Lytechinus variegatus]XP_041472416.1 uncharacterized oxidoreductase YjmC-like isoform X2 [Lytechinus variegatus]